jgi:ABC-type lipoprotein release transport system permease subunit
VRDGDDASCLNLNQAQTPRLLGVSNEEFESRRAFESGEGESIWQLLYLDLPDGAIPALVGDSDTAMWTLRKKTGVDKGDVLVYQDETGGEVPIKLVGKLPMRLSVFQGSVLISQESFTRLFPSEDGYRMFLVDASPEEASDVATQLSRKFDRYGLDAIPALDRLMEFYAVEITYLAMFVVLGGLGLAVGGIGMGVVVLRNLIERRGELATLEALGFTRGTLLKTLYSEYGFLVLAGLGIGGISAAVAMLPVWFAAESSGSPQTMALVALIVVGSYALCMLVAVWTGLRGITYNSIRRE